MMRVAYVDGSYRKDSEVYRYGWVEDTGFECVFETPTRVFPKPYSSHYAEYLGVVSFIPAHFGEEWILKTDSNLVYNQLTKNWKVKAKALKDINLLARELYSGSNIELKLIRSKKNKADKLLRGW